MQRLLRTFVLPVSLGFAASTFAPVARADADSDAQDLFVRGRDLREKGDFAGAAALFRKANALAPARLGSLRNLAECEEQLGHFASSRRAWLELRRGLLTNKDPKYDPWAKDADDAAARLLPKVAQLTLDVIVQRVDGEGPVKPAERGVEITINGETLPLSLAATTLDRDPGHYDIRVAGKDVETPAAQAIDLSAGATRSIKLRVVLKPPPVDPVETTERMHPRRVAGFVTLGIGGATLIGSAVTFALRQGALSDLESACKNYETGPCPRTVESTVSKGKTMSTLTTVFLISGGVLAATGLTLVLASPDIQEPVRRNAMRMPSLRLTPSLSPSMGGLLFEGGFQ